MAVAIEFCILLWAPEFLGLVCRPETVVTPQLLRDAHCSPGFNLFAAFGAEESAATHWPYRGSYWLWPNAFQRIRL